MSLITSEWWWPWGILGLVAGVALSLLGLLTAPTHKPELVCVRAEWSSPTCYVALNILISEEQYHNDVMTLLPLSQCREVK